MEIPAVAESQDPANPVYTDLVNTLVAKHRAEQEDYVAQCRKEYQRARDRSVRTFLNFEQARKKAEGFEKVYWEAVQEQDRLKVILDDAVAYASTLGEDES